MRSRRDKFDSVESMLRNGWDVISCCQKCGLTMRVNLALIIRVSGPDVSLWNRKERCRRLGCTGWVAFQARAPDMVMHEVLSAPERSD